MTTPLPLDHYTHARLVALLADWGFAAVHAARLWRYLYREQVESFARMEALPARLRARLVEETRLTSLTLAAETHSSDQLTRKFLLALDDGPRIETVAMRFADRTTACLSSQAGCALGCLFCATGQSGFTRQLTTGEIVAQALFVARARDASTPALSNLVLMGMGEPMHNYDAVMDALEIVRDPAGLAIGVKQITISTVGVAPGIVRMADERRPYSLAVSLHAATQEERAAMIPAAHAWPLDELMRACRYYVERLRRKIFFEWTLIDGQNDSPRHAVQLAELIDGLSAQVNLIPLNPTAGFSGEPGRTAAAAEFQAILRRRGVPTTIRQRRGIDIAAGCGQLAGDGAGS